MAGLPPLPPGFTLDQQQGVPPLPPGFTLDQEPGQEPGLRSTAMQFLYGANERLADIYEAPRRLADMVTGPIARALPGGSGRSAETPIDPLTQPFRNTPEPTTPGQRIARRAGQEVGATAPLAALPFMAPAAKALGPAKTVLGAAGRSLLQGIQNTPARAAAGELAATVGSGTGAGIAQEIAPGSAAAEMTGQLLGGLTPTALTMTPTALAAQVGRKAIQRLSPQAAREQARQEVGRAMGAEMTPQAEARLAEAQGLSRDIQGFEPSLAEATGSPGLAATQRSIQNQASGVDLERLAQRRAGNEAAISRFANQSAPEHGGSAEFVIDTATGRVDRLRSGVERQQADIARQAEDLANTIPMPGRASMGENIRGRLEDARRDMAQEMRFVADAYGISNSDVTVQFNQAKREILDEFKPQSVFEDMRNYPEVLQDIQQAGETVTFADLKALRERLTDDIIDTQASPKGRTKRLRVLVALQKKVDDIIDSLVEAEDPGLAERYRAFRETYKREYIDRFEKGAVLKVRQKDGRGFYRLPDEQVAAAFFAPGEVTAARQFKSVFGTDPEAVAALETVALDSLRDAAVRDGRIDPRLFQTWKRRHASILDEFPSLNRAVANLEMGTEGILRRQAQLAARSRKIEDQILVRELNRHASGKTPEAVIDAALNDQRKMASLVSALRGNADAKTALQRHLWDRVAEGSAREIDAFLTRFEPSLKWALGGGHIDNLRKIQRAREMLETVPAPEGRGFSPVPFAGVEEAIGTGLPQISSRVFAVQSGRTSARFVASEMFGRFIRGMSKTQSEALLKQALFDPEVARDLASLTQMKKVPPAVANRLNVRLFNLGLASREDQERGATRPVKTRPE